MKRIVASALITAMVLGAVYGAAASISLGGVDQLEGGSMLVSNIELGAICTDPTGAISVSVICSTP